MDVLKELEVLLKNDRNLDVLGIRYYNGPENFSNMYDNYRSNSLEGSLKLMIECKKSLENPVPKPLLLKNGKFVEQVC